MITATRKPAFHPPLPRAGQAFLAAAAVAVLTLVGTVELSRHGLPVSPVDEIRVGATGMSAGGG